MKKATALINLKDLQNKMTEAGVIGTPDIFFLFYGKAMVAY